VHLQNNRKLNINGKNTELIAHEIGINRYEKIISPDLKAGDVSFQKTEPYWAEVRQKWSEIFATKETFSLKNIVDEKKLFFHHFEYAAKVEKDGRND